MTIVRLDPTAHLHPALKKNVIHHHLSGGPRTKGSSGPVMKKFTVCTHRSHATLPGTVLVPEAPTLPPSYHLMLLSLQAQLFDYLSHVEFCLFRKTQTSIDFFNPDWLKSPTSQVSWDRYVYIQKYIEEQRSAWNLRLESSFCLLRSVCPLSYISSLNLFSQL